jgi:hypothetical protein
VPRPNSDDTVLLAELRAAGALDPVPADAIAAARAAFVWRTIDAELAELTYDSLLEGEEEKELAGVRGPATARSLTFASDDLTVELDASAVGAGRRLVGQLVPPQPGEVEVRHAGGTVTVPADELGRFSADVAAGPVSLHCRGGRSPTPVTTDWVIV